MNIKPILFSTEMVQAILEGRKTQTRRIIKPQPKKGIIATAFDFKKGFYASKIKIEENPDRFEITKLFNPKYQTGDILWVRESFAKPPIYAFGVKYIYKAGFNESICGWKPSIHMPKEAARIFLEVTNVRVERLQDISEEDAIAEGIDKKGDLYFNYFESKLLGIGLQKEYFYKEIPKVSFMSLWSKINGEDSWNANPWVWVYEFKVVEKPKDFIYEN